jgi:hypothetical protein
MLMPLSAWWKTPRIGLWRISTSGKQQNIGSRDRLVDRRTDRMKLIVPFPNLTKNNKVSLYHME